MNRESSRNVTFAPCGWAITCGGATVWMSIKFKRTPRLHIRSDFRQLRHRPSASSHFKCLSRQVKHPVRTRLAFVSAMSEGFLRLALGGRGELLFRLFGVVDLESDCGDCDLDWERVLRFILSYSAGRYPRGHVLFPLSRQHQPTQ